jgi:hypothetical protein
VKAIIVGTYRRSLDSKQIDSTLTIFLRRVRLKYPLTTILVFGDLNTESVDGI